MVNDSVMLNLFFFKAVTIIQKLFQNPHSNTEFGHVCKDDEYKSWMSSDDLNTAYTNTVLNIIYEYIVFK